MPDPLVWRVARLAEYDPVRFREIWEHSTLTEIAWCSAARAADHYIPPGKK